MGYEEEEGGEEKEEEELADEDDGFSSTEGRKPLAWEGDMEDKDTDDTASPVISPALLGDKSYISFMRVSSVVPDSLSYSFN